MNINIAISPNISASVSEHLHFYVHIVFRRVYANLLLIFLIHIDVYETNWQSTRHNLSNTAQSVLCFDFSNLLLPWFWVIAVWNTEKSLFYHSNSAKSLSPPPGNYFLKANVCRLWHHFHHYPLAGKSSKRSALSVYVAKHLRFSIHSF